VRRLAAADPDVRLVCLRQNQGKGGAVMAGLAARRKPGLPTRCQIDADGQHDPADLPKFMAAPPPSLGH